MHNLGNNWHNVHCLTNIRPFFQSEKPANCLGLDFIDIHVIRIWASTGKKYDEVGGKFSSSIT